MLPYLIKGIIVGLTVSIPVGPVGLMCLDMTVTHGKRAGLSCAYGMVTADILSATIMLFGIGLIYTFIVAHAIVIKIATGILFACLGILLYRKRHENKKSPPNTATRAGLSISSFLFSISPATFALMIFLFPALNLTENVRVLPILAGVAIGSTTWCCIILGAGKFIRKMIGNKLAYFKGAIGCLFVAIGLIAVLTTVLNTI